MINLDNMARHGNFKELQYKFRQQRKHSRSLNDLYGKNIWNGGEPEKDENYWNFRVSLSAHTEEMVLGQNMHDEILLNKDFVDKKFVTATFMKIFCFKNDLS